MPRFFHLADLHLGRIFHGEALLEDQAHIIRQISDICAADPPDALIIAGDIFDRAIPPVEAMKLLDDLFSTSAAAGIPVIAISGNHDSPGRLGYGSRAWERMGINLRADYGRLNQPLTIRGRDGGELDVFTLPFVEGGLLREVLIDKADDAEYGRNDLVKIALDRMRAGFTPGCPKVLVAHEFVAGSMESGSERLYVGGSQSVPSELFGGFHYVALGHIHGSQAAGDQYIRYSGSPMAYAFDEAGKERGFLDVVMDSTRLYPDVRFRSLKPLRPLAILEDSLDNLLNLGEYLAFRESYVSARVTDSHSHLNLIGRLRERFPHLREIRQIPLEPPGYADTSYRSPAAETPGQVFEDFLIRCGWENEHERHAALALMTDSISVPGDLH
jgi:exonuclease SbcD